MEGRGGGSPGKAFWGRLKLGPCFKKRLEVGGKLDEVMNFPIIHVCQSVPVLHYM